MKSLLLLTAFIIIVSASCKKHDDAQYSTWYVNGQKIITNDVHETIGKSVATLGSSGYENSFNIVFQYGYLVDNANFYLEHTTVLVGDSVGVNFYHNSKFYLISPADHVTKLYAGHANGKIQYTLPECWFVSYDNYNDSVKISGIFNEP